MSADNLYAVWLDPEQIAAGNEQWNVAHVFASPLGEDCMYLADHTPEYVCKTRAEALVIAHDCANEMDVLEYGVQEFKVPTQVCGACYVCINNRHVVADDVHRCTKCGEPIIDMAVGTMAGWFHKGCEPRWDGEDL